MALGRSVRMMWLGTMVAAASFVGLGVGCGGDDEPAGGGGAGAATSSTTTFTYSTTTTTGAGGTGGADVDPAICDQGWEKFSTECGLRLEGTGGAGGNGSGVGGAEPEPNCGSFETCRAYCWLDATCTEIEQLNVHYLDCISCCDDYNGC